MAKTSSTHTPHAAHNIDPPDQAIQSALKILKNDRRYLIIKCIEHTEAYTSRDLAKQIAAIMNKKPLQEVEASEQKTVYVSLYQTHLPTLAEADAIEYDPRSGDVARGQLFESYKNLTDQLQSIAEQFN